MARVYCTGNELYHLVSKTGEYDGKIEVKPNMVQQMIIRARTLTATIIVMMSTTKTEI